MKCAVFERQQGQTEQALETVKTALAKFPKFAKLYMIQGQILQAQGNVPAARATYAAGYKACPKGGGREEHPFACAAREGTSAEHGK
jgi:pre-mRNA-processing factor 6